MNWYVIKVINNKEKKIKENIENELKRNNSENIISKIVIASQNSIQIRKGKKINVEKNLYPGYIFIECESINDVESNIKHVNGVYNILKNPLSEIEINRIILKENKINNENFALGQKVKIIDGPFNSFYGVIKNVDNDKQKAKVSINIFDRENIIDLTFLQMSPE